MVDLDLRRPSVAKFFGVENQPGVTDVAIGRVRLEDVLASFAIGEDGGRVVVVGAGTVPPSATEFLESNSLRAVLRDISARVDLVLIDSPPVLPVSDALVMSKFVDGVVVVVRASSLRRPALRELGRTLAQMEARVLGFAMSGTETGARYGSYYGYRSVSEASTASTAPVMRRSSDIAHLVDGRTPAAPLSGVGDRPVDPDAGRTP